MMRWSRAGLDLPGEVDTEIRAMKGSEVIDGKRNNPDPSHVHSAVQEGCCAPGGRGRQEPHRGRHAPEHRAQPSAALERTAVLEAGARSVYRPRSRDRPGGKGARPREEARPCDD